MIVQVAREVEALLERRAALENARTQSHAIEETLQELGKVVSASQGVARTFGLIAGYLAEEDRSRAREEMATLGQIAQLSHERFSDGQRWQVSALRQLAQRIRDLEPSLDTSWARWAQEQVSRADALFGVVRGLLDPADLARLDLQRSMFLPYERKAPRSKRELDVALAALEQFRRDAEARVQDLPQHIREFLRRVQIGRVTLADVTPEILAWCIQSGHATRFHVQLGGTAR